jgi:hypothetical protein
MPFLVLCALRHWLILPQWGGLIPPQGGRKSERVQSPGLLALIQWEEEKQETPSQIQAARVGWGILSASRYLCSPGLMRGRLPYRTACFSSQLRS